MNLYLAALVRTVVYAAALVGYHLALPHLFPDDGGGANIGAGLIAFAALVVISFGWSILDGRTRGLLPAIIVWAIVSAAVAVGWLVVRAFVEATTTDGALEIIANDLVLLPFTAGLIIAPACMGAAIGQATRTAS